MMSVIATYVCGCVVVCVCGCVVVCVWCVCVVCVCVWCVCVVCVWVCGCVGGCGMAYPGESMTAALTGLFRMAAAFLFPVA